MTDIQVGLDIATSLSVVVAAITFLFSLRRENTRTIADRRRELRVSKMTSVVASLVQKLEEGFTLDEEVKMAVVAGKTEDVPMLAYKYAKSLEILMTVALGSELAVWGSSAEIQTISRLRDETRKWYEVMLGKDVRPITDLLSDIRNAIQEIAKELRQANET